jgi:hypothetical protein
MYVDPRPYAPVMATVQASPSPDQTSVVTPVEMPPAAPRGSIRPVATSITQPAPSRKHVTLISTPPVIVTQADSEQAKLGLGGFSAVSYFQLDFIVGSATNRPFRIAVAASGGYRNDFVTGWYAAVPAAGAHCVALRADVLGVEILRRGLELPTALPGMGESATSRVPTTIEPGGQIPVHVTFGCSAAIHVGQLLSGRIRLLIGQNGSWLPEDLSIQEQPIVCSPGCRR